MAINLTKLEKGQRINLEKSDGKKLTKFFVGCNWGAIMVESSSFFGLIKNTEELDVDVDLSCIMTDENGQLVDTLYSPLYKPEFLAQYNLPAGKDWSADKSMFHTPDDTEGDKGGDDGLDNEIITVDLEKVNSKISQIFFFLNIYSPRDIDFLKIPYAAIRMCEYEGTQDDIKFVKEVFAQYDVAKDSQFAGKNALIMGKLYRRNGEWKFAAIGDAYNDQYDLRKTVKRILASYTK